METHNYVAAIAPLKRALELNPELDAAHLQLGYALLSQGSAAEAIPHLERVHALEALGIAQIETGQYQEAIANLSAALVKRPNDPDLLYYLGRASGLLSKQAIDTLLSAYPDSARAHQAMGENYFVLRQMPQAEKEYSEALRQRPDIPGLQLELGLVYAGAAQWSKAEEAFRAETRRQPGNAEAAYRLGAVLLQQGNAHEARAEARHAGNVIFTGKSCFTRRRLSAGREIMDQSDRTREGDVACCAGAFRASGPLSQARQDGEGGTRNAGVPETAEHRHEASR